MTEISAGSRTRKSGVCPHRAVLALLVATLLFLSGCAHPPGRSFSDPEDNPEATDELAVMSFNIRMIHDNDASRQSWTERRADVASVIQRHAPAIVALQEVETRTTEPMPRSRQLAYLQGRLPGYVFACIPEPGVLSRQPILYDAERLRLIDEGMILDAPVDRYRAGFRGRIATWALFELHRPGGEVSTRLRVINVHYHHLFTSSQLASSLRIREFLGRLSDQEAVIVMGDFNLPAGSQLLDPLRDAGLRHALPPSRTGSYHFFSGRTLWPRIDHILVNDQIRSVDGYMIYDRTERGYPSDHFPVVARLAIEDQRPLR